MPVTRRTRAPGSACRVLSGDCLEVLASLPEDHFDAVVTDPPYGLEFMGRDWDTFKPSASHIRKPSGKDETSDRAHNSTTSLVGRNAPEAYIAGPAYQEWCKQWSRECLRVLKPGGYMLTFGGTRTWHWLACAVELSGFEIRDSIDWIYGSGFPKNKASLKPAHEPIILARKPARRSTPLSGLDACRVGAEVMRESRMTQVAGGVLNMNGRDVEHGNWKQKPNDNPAEHIGRWPPNVLLTHHPDCMPTGSRTIRNRSGSISPDVPSGPVREVYRTRRRVSWAAHGDNGTEIAESLEGCVPGCPVAELDAQSGYSSERVRVLQRNGKRQMDGWGLKAQSQGIVHADSGGASRFFPAFRYQAKAPSKERPRLPDGTAWPTVKPLELMRWLVRLITPPGGTVLDPFAGTGTTGQACLAEGFSAVLIERDPAALELIRVRIPELGEHR